jgi:hypothetical protein
MYKKEVKVIVNRLLYHMLRKKVQTIILNKEFEQVKVENYLSKIDEEK